MNKLLSIALGTLILISSCTKEKNFIDKISDNSEGIGFGLNGSSSLSLDIVPGVSPTADTTIKVFLSSSKGAGSAKVAVDNSVVDAYNAAQGTSFEYAPTDSYTIPGDVTFSGGSNEADLKLSIDLNKLLASGTQFALGLTLSPTGGTPIIAGQKSVIVIINVRNKYDGTYQVTGTMVDYANASLTGYYPWDVQLVTSSANQVILYDVNITGKINHIIMNGSNISLYGSFGVVINFDANNNVTSVVNYYGQPSGNGRSAELDPSGINKWDPATQSLDIKYWMNQPSVISPHRVSFDEHFEYTGPR